MLLTTAKEQEEKRIPLLLGKNGRRVELVVKPLKITRGKVTFGAYIIDDGVPVSLDKLNYPAA